MGVAIKEEGLVPMSAMLVSVNSQTVLEKVRGKERGKEVRMVELVILHFYLDDWK